MTYSDCRRRVRKCAYANAITLALIVVMFVITWVLIIAVNVWEATNAH